MAGDSFDADNDLTLVETGDGVVADEKKEGLAPCMGGCIVGFVRDGVLAGGRAATVAEVVEDPLECSAMGGWEFRVLLAPAFSLSLGVNAAVSITVRLVRSYNALEKS